MLRHVNCSESRIMKIHTEKEFLEYNQKEAFRLRQLYLKDQNLFNQVVDYLPFSVHLNNRKTLDTVFSNKILDDWAGGEGEDIKTKGFPFVRIISDPDLLNRMLLRIKTFEKINDPLSVCSVMQFLRFDGKMRFFYVNKLFLDNQNYLNIGFRMDKFGKPGMLVHSILSEVIGDMGGWQKFQSLTKQEKVILLLLAKGCNNQDIADQLFISHHTVRTHRKQIYKKLDVGNISDLIKYAQAFELIY